MPRQPPHAPLTCLALVAGPAGLAEAEPGAAVTEPPVLALTALLAVQAMLSLGTGWQGHRVRHCPGTHPPSSHPPAHTARTQLPERHLQPPQTIPNQDLCALELLFCLVPHPARRPALSSLQDKHRLPWPGHRCHRSGRGSAAGSPSRKNPLGRLREKQDKHPSQDTALEACATLWVAGLMQRTNDTPKAAQLPTKLLVFHLLR